MLHIFFFTQSIITCSAAHALENLSFGNNKLLCRTYHTTAAILLYSYLLYAAFLPFNQSHVHTQTHTQFVNFLQPRARSLHSFFVMTHSGSPFSSLCLLFTMHDAPHFPSTRLTRMQRGALRFFTLLHTHLLLFFRFIFSCALF